MPAPASASAATVPTVLDGNAMWIWVLKKSSRGDPAKLIAKARKYGINSIIVKGADARSRWRQFSPALVRQLKAAGLRVCAYQYVYGVHPLGEANLAVKLARLGADCILIDAESQYEGKYWQAQSYIGRIRKKLGPDYPLALAGFPYVHFHAGFPYSVFLGPSGAQLNTPQVYWKAIGTSVDRAMSVTFQYNRVYGRPVLPLGQLYQNPSSRQIKRFRFLSRAYGARGLSWWDWQESNIREWRALKSLLDLPDLFPPPVRYPLLKRGWRGDLVVWAQEHLLSTGIPTKVDGIYGVRMRNSVRAFQTSVLLPSTGQIGPRTWQALLPHGPAAIKWTRRNKARPVVAASATGGRSAPRSAKLPARRNELRGVPRG